jgi:DNA-binding GntR family transcriptional regulator
VFPRRGTFAAEINITDLAHITDVRVELEGHAAYRAAERTAATNHEGLEALLDELDRSETMADTDALVALDARVHRFVYRCAGNPYLEETLSRYFNLSLRIWHLVIDRVPHLAASVLEHRALLIAIRDGDADRARAIAGEHVITFAREIRSVL